MTERQISDEMLNAFVDRQLASEDRLRILRTIAADHGLGQEVCDRHRLKELLHLAYGESLHPPRPARECRFRLWRWWRR